MIPKGATHVDDNGHYWEPVPDDEHQIQMQGTGGMVKYDCAFAYRLHGARLIRNRTQQKQKQQATHFTKIGNTMAIQVSKRRFKVIHNDGTVSSESRRWLTEALDVGNLITRELWLKMQQEKRDNEHYAGQFEACNLYNWWSQDVSSASAMVADCAIQEMMK